MADPQAQPDQGSQPSPDIASLAGPSGKSAIADLVKVQEKKTAEDASIANAADKKLDRDSARMEQAFQAEGVAASEQLKPWDANKEHKKFESDPIEGFGSLGGLFAVVASAFTKAPMENAINGMAGAINSLKEGNEAAYERAHQSWKDNTKLALDRFKTQHELYQDAMSLMNQDAAAAQAKLHNAAVRFGDSQTLMLAEHGMVKELYELQDARLRAAEQTQEFADKTTLRTFQKAAIGAIAKNPPNTGDPVQDKMMLAAQVQRVFDGGAKYGSAEQEAVGKYVIANVNKNPQEFVDGLAQIHQQFSPKAPNIQGYQDARQQYMDAHDGTIPSDEDAKLLQQFGLSARPTGAGGAGGNPALHPEKIELDKRTKQYTDENVAKGMPAEAARKDAFDRASREVKMASQAPSGNRIDDLRSKIDQTDNIVEGAQKNLDFLRQFKGGAGLMGKVMRGEEIASNIVGAGTQSERVEFRRRVHELQEMVPRIITDSNGRPLKAAQDKVDDFVAGLNAGDTGPNTIRAYEELIAEMQKRQQDYRGRIEGGYEPGSKSSGAAAGAAEQKPASADWLNAYPEVK